MVWKDEIKRLWTDVGEASAIGNSSRVYKGKKGFGYNVRGGATPGNTTVRELLSDVRFFGGDEGGVC